MTYGYSDDLRKKALKYYESSGKSQAEVSGIFGVSHRTFAQWVKLCKAGNFRRRAQQKRRAPMKIESEALRRYIEQHPDAYFREIAVVFKVSDVGILKACRRLGITRKKTLLYCERDEVERATFRSVVAQIPADQIVWVDETGIEERLFRAHARTTRGMRALGNISGKRVGRTTLIAGYGAGGLKAPMRFKGYTNTRVFNAWVAEVLAPELTANNVVVMDSASFHKSKATRDIIEATGATLLFQPKYSSEPQWANLKHRI